MWVGNQANSNNSMYGVKQDFGEGIAAFHAPLSSSATR